MYQSKSSLEVAVEAAARVDAVLAKRGKIKPNPIATALATANKSSTDLFQTEFEINDVPLTARNLLTKGITQEEINHFSGASISTRGRYVTPEDRPKLPKGERPLYLFIQGPNKQSLDLAIQRIDSLIKEVMEQEKFKMGIPPPMITMQTSLPGMEKVIIGLDNAPPTFDVRNKVLGPAGANLQYISNETGAVVTLRGRSSGYPEAGTGQESPEPLHICVEHQKIEVLQAARQLAFNLVETIQQEFNQIHPQLTQPPMQMPPQPGQLQTVTLQPDQLPPGMVPTTLQLPVLGQQPGQVGQLVNMPPPSLTVPPPQLLQQPPPVTLPPPGVHIPPHQGPLVPQQQAIIQQQILQQPPPNVAPPGHTQISHQVISQGGPILSQPPPSITSQTPPTSVVTSIPQQTQAFITHATYPVQYIQTANGQTLMAYPQMKPGEAQGQVQLIQAQPGQQPAQLQLIPGPGGTQQLVMQQPQQVTMLLQYQQQNEPGKGRLLAGQQRLATPVQIQLQPGVQLINPQLLQPGQTQVQLQLQQPITQQLMQQTVRAISPQQLQLTRPPGPQQMEQQQVQQQIQQLQQQQQQQQGPPQHQHPPPQQILQIQPQQGPPQVQQIHQIPPGQQLQQISPNQVQQMNLQQPPQSPQQSQQNSQQVPQNLQQSPQQVQQNTQQQRQPQTQQSQQQQAQQQLQQQHMQQQSPHKEGSQQQNQANQQMQKQNQPGMNQQQPVTGNQMPPPQPQQQQQGQKRSYEGDQQPQSNTYRGPPQPVPPPKMMPPQKNQPPSRGVGNGASSAQKAAVAPLSQLPPQIQKQLLPPPPPPQPGAPDEWRNNQPPELMNQGERVEQPVPQGDNRAANGTRQERPTFNHYSSKPQLYNANMPFHMQGLGAYPPPPPPPPPGPTPPMAGQFPFYQQPPATSQYPYFMMHHQQ
ncbi:transcription factor SPT20 homolog isoform X2 [Homalodisca vitripennis]|uniref:transcription factor SPT20 homolog isoform X2 n=1 Tax=Homalodisca vitripennis TaxID=197043 RepID=UPI001EEC0A5B|nr:transcription factor SPT20 homolog isoform X2 [Homalodisca vitripennis]